MPVSMLRLGSGLRLSGGGPSRLNWVKTRFQISTSLPSGIRKKISLQSTAGTAWTDGWHHARVVRKVGAGTIEVFFDNMETPVMRAEDKTFVWGQVGVGSFDDTGNFDELAVFGERVVKPVGKSASRQVGQSASGPVE